MTETNQDGKYWEFPGQYEYEGVVYCPAFPREALEQIKEFKLYPEDVLLPNYPKSGTVWLGEIVWLLCHNADVEEAKNRHNRVRVPMIESVRPGTSGNVAVLNDMPPGRVISTHLLPYFYEKEVERTKAKVIVIMRNPKDTLVSYYHFYKATAMLGNFSGTFHEFFNLFLGKRLNHGDFFDHVLQWWAHKDDDNYLFVKYEDMRKDLEGHVRKIAAFLGKDMTDEQIKSIVHYTSFDQMKANPTTQMTSNKFYDSKISPYIRKGKVGDWKSYFTVEESELMDQIYEERMTGSGLDFQFQ